MPMDIEGPSISSWIGKIREGFDTFCLEAKDILPQKPVENIVQEQLITAAETLKKLCFDLNVFSNFKLDSEQGNSPKFAEMEEKMDLHSEDVTKSAEMEEKTDLGLVKSDTSSSELPTLEEDDISGSDFELEVSVLKDNSTKRFDIEEVPYECPPASVEGLEGLQDRLIASCKCNVDSHDDKHKSSSVSRCKFCTSTQEYALAEDDSSGETNPDYSHLLGLGLHDELIKHGFLSPLSGSVQSIISKQSEETEEIDCLSHDKVTSSVNNISSRTSNSIRVRDMSTCWSNCKQSSDCDPVVVAAQSNQENVEKVQDNEWERLDEDFNDEDWEIV